MEHGPTPLWMLPAWQTIQPDDAVAHAPYSNMDRSSTIPAPQASSGQVGGSADRSQPNCGSDNLSADSNTALQELKAMSKSQVSSVTQSVCTATRSLLCVCCCRCCGTCPVQRPWRMYDKIRKHAYGSWCVTFRCFPPSINFGAFLL